MLITFLRYLRHGPLRFANRFWVICGKFYRKTVARIARPTRQKIGDYGPFKLNPHFSFSNFKNWGQKHNDCFDSCIKACRGKKVVFDIGAHIGLVTMPIASVLSSEGKVYAFEPALVNRKFLQQHIILNRLEDKVVLEPFLVGDLEIEDQKFYEAEADSGMNSITPVGKGDGVYETSKKQVTLDSYCFKNKIFPEIIKIDVEGAEIAVLEGAFEILKTYKPIIFLSVHPKHIKLLGKSLDELKDILTRLNYICRQSDGTLVKNFSFKEYILTPERKLS